MSTIPLWFIGPRFLRDKGTNRQQFYRGEVDKYTWVDVGSSYVPSEISSAFLFGQLEMMDNLTERRRKIYQFYHRHLKALHDERLLRIPILPEEILHEQFPFVLLDHARHGVP